MRVIGLELNDIGIMAAAAGRCLQVDGDRIESPGYALSEKKKYRIGGEAEHRAYLNPRDINTTFWDRLDTEPLKQPGFEGGSHSEFAYEHLKKIWHRVRKHGDGFVIAAPDDFGQETLGRILGLTEALSIPVVGFVPISIAASSASHPEKLLAVVDIHLHRAVVTVLSQSDRLYAAHTESITDAGRYGFYTQFARIVAEAFVQQTRYDPFHRAASEQQLYHRLPDILRDLSHESTVQVKMRAGVQIHEALLSRETFIEKIQPVVDGICRIIEACRKDAEAPDAPVLLQVTHRAESLFGFKDIRFSLPNLEITALKPGAAALGALSLADQFDNRSGVSLLSSRPWTGIPKDHENGSGLHKDQTARPTHLLYENFAYPIAGQPLLIGRGGANGKPEVFTSGASTDRSNRYFTMKLQAEDILLVPDGTNGIFVDGVKVVDAVALKLGQSIQVEGFSEPFRLIATV